MGQNKKYTNKMLLYSTIASIFGHRTDTMIPFISINQSCDIKHNSSVKQVINYIETYLKAEEELQKRYIWCRFMTPLTMRRKHKYHINKKAFSKNCVDHDKLVFISHNKANIQNLLLCNTITCISRRNLYNMNFQFPEAK